MGTQLCPEVLPHGEGHPEKLGSGRAVSHLSTRKVDKRTKVLPWEIEGSSCFPGKSVVSHREKKPSWKCFEVTQSSQFTMHSFLGFWTKEYPSWKTFHLDRWLPWAPGLLGSGLRNSPWVGLTYFQAPGGGSGASCYSLLVSVRSRIAHWALSKGNHHHAEASAESQRETPDKML